MSEIADSAAGSQVAIFKTALFPEESKMKWLYSSRFRSRGEANMLKILPIILFHSAHKLSFEYARFYSIDYSIFSVEITRFIKVLLFF